MKRLAFIIPTALIAVAFFVNACKKEAMPEPNTPAKPTPYYVRMTDAPGPYTEVNVDIQSVVITGNGGNNVTLNTNPGVYNLLDFANGVDTLLASGSLTVDKVEQIRLILGPNNSVVTGGVTYPLKVPSGEQSGLKLNVHQTLQPGVAYYVLLDFDANQSIVEKGNGDYSLKPVIRTIEAAVSGSIKGKVVPGGVITSITATSGGVSYSTVVNSMGEFILKGLPAGTYTVVVNPISPYVPVTINNVSVSVGVSTTIGPINI